MFFPSEDTSYTMELESTQIVGWAPRKLYCTGRWIRNGYPLRVTNEPCDPGTHCCKCFHGVDLSPINQILDEEQRFCRYNDDYSTVCVFMCNRCKMKLPLHVGCAEIISVVQSQMLYNHQKYVIGTNDPDHTSICPDYVRDDECETDRICSEITSTEIMCDERGMPPELKTMIIQCTYPEVNYVDVNKKNAGEFTVCRRPVFGWPTSLSIADEDMAQLRLVNKH